MQSALDAAVAIYPHIDNTCWDTDSEETEESAIEQLHDIVNSLFQLASPLNDQRKKLGHTANEQLTIFYKQLILERFPQAKGHLILRVAQGSKKYHELVRSQTERNKTPVAPSVAADESTGPTRPTQPILAARNPIPPSATETHTHTVTPSAHDSGYSSMNLTIPQYTASIAESITSSFSICSDQAHVARLPRRPDASHEFRCILCSEPQTSRSKRVLSDSKWR